MSDNSFKVKRALTLEPQDLTLLSNAQAGDLACDINDSNKIKRYDATSASWKEVGSGGVGNVDALLTQTFDSASLVDFTQTGLALVTSNTINGTQSARLIHDTPITGVVRSFKQTLSVDRKYRSELMQLSMQVRSTASSGNLTLLVTDETNAVTIAASQQIDTGSQTIASLVTNSTTTVSGFSNSAINSLSIGMSVTGSGIPTGTLISAINTTALTITLSQAATASATVSLNFSSLPDRRTFSFTIPANCASMSYTVTALQEANSPESYIDDIVIALAQTALLSTSVTVPNVTAWRGYTPTFQGFGTPTNVEFEWRQVGENVEVRGKFTNGSPTAVEGRIGLPTGLSSAGTSIIPTIQIAGVGAFGTNVSTVIPYLLIEPSVSYFTVGFNNGTTAGLTKQNGNAFMGAANVFSFTASVPCAGLSATSDKTIALTQSGLIQEADSSIRLDTYNGYGSTATKIPRFANIRQNIGDAILYQDSAVNGASFTALESGTYSFAFTIQSPVGTGATAGLSLNASGADLSTNVSSLTLDKVLHQPFTPPVAGSTTGPQVTWTGYLNAGDVVRPHTNGAVPNATPFTSFSASYQGSLKQIAVSSDQKLRIPTSELRFEGASARGSTATAIVKFDTLAKIRGDAFTVTNTAADGTYVTMTKAGRLSINSSLYFAATGASIAISLNQVTLTSATTLGSTEYLSVATIASGQNAAVSWSGEVKVGDILRITSSQTPTASSANSLNLSFQEQQVQVSVSNTLPQFSESDSAVRVTGGLARGTSWTSVARFGSLRENIGSDIVYVDSATDGASFTVQSSGIYNMSFGWVQSVAGSMAISKNQSSPTATVDTITEAERLAYAEIADGGTNNYDTISATVFLNQGDIIRPMASQATSNAPFCFFEMTKVGKPNVTGVDVTPFVEIPQPTNGSARLIGYNGGTGGYRLFDSTAEDNNNGIFSISSSLGYHTITFLKNASTSIHFGNGSNSLVNNAYIIGIEKNGINVASSQPGDAGSGNIPAPIVSYSGLVNAGDIIKFIGPVTVPAYGDSTVYANILASALSDQILTAPETFSTDTAGLTYAGSGTYTLSTLANAPVGTFITFTYAASTNTRTQTTTAPTQTTADMNANGILLYTRAYNAASTAAQPAEVAIQIGKGLKGLGLSLYKSSGKATTGSIDFGVFSPASYGLYFKEYNEITGVLILNAAIQNNISNTTAVFNFSDGTQTTSGYLVINASKNPALTGFSLPRVAARGVNTSGYVVQTVDTTLTYDSTKIFDTNGALNASTGVFTAPESGYYQVNAGALVSATTYTVDQALWTVIYKNGATYSQRRWNAQTTASVILQGGVSDIVYLVKNDTLEFKLSLSKAGIALTSSVGYNYFSIAKVGN